MSIELQQNSITTMRSKVIHIFNCITLYIIFQVESKNCFEEDDRETLRNSVPCFSFQVLEIVNFLLTTLYILAQIKNKDIQSLFKFYVNNEPP
jgi:hypothetical protein